MYNENFNQFADRLMVTIPGQEAPVIGDGKTYKRSPVWQSPEGNFYGNRYMVLNWPVCYIWDGTEYLQFEPMGLAQDVDRLPSGYRLHMEVWLTPRPGWPQEDENGLIADSRPYDFYWWDAENQSWNDVVWFQNIREGESLPYPGFKIGGAHVYIKEDIEVFWNGFYWTRRKHSDFIDNEPEKHISPGFTTNYNSLFGRVADARLEFLSKTTLGLWTSVTGKVGGLYISGEIVITDDVVYALNTDSELRCVNGSIVSVSLLPNTEYYVYCGNTAFTAASKKLFLSLTPDINGYLDDVTPGLNARIVGKVETDDQGYFIREIDMSLIGKKVEFSQTFWEYSDYYLQFVDQDTLSFTRIDGTHGLCYINGQLVDLGTGKDLFRSDKRIIWSDGPSIDSSSISVDTTYQIYIANNSYEYNFNELSETGLPLEQGEIGYDSTLDFRTRVFLSSKEHDHRVLDEQYPGYYARHIGQIQTDENGYFKYAADISLIRQPTLNPTHLDGLAECVIESVSTTEFKIARKKGTTGLVYVGGRATQTYAADNPLAHVISLTDPLYSYDEEEIDAPLVDTGMVLSEKPGIFVYVYLANDNACWGGISTFCSLEEPIAGYLSNNWPGINARWICTVQLAPDALGTEKATNGAFTSDVSWSKGTGWDWSSPNQNMKHTAGNVAALEQNMSAVSGEEYAIAVTVTERTIGSVTPYIGGVAGSVISTNTASLQYILATGTGNFQIIPSTDFAGAIDNVSVKKVTSGKFSGSYIKDSVSGTSASIDDSIISSSVTYSSQKIESIRQELLTKISAAATFELQKTAGLNLRLDYVNASTIRLSALGSAITVVFPNADSYTVPTAGITKAVTGSTSTLYYVYLNAAGLDILTSAPDGTYTNLQVRGDANVLVGYIGCSSTNALGGTHSVFSFWNQAALTWSAGVSNCTSGTYISTTLNGFVVPPGKTATLGRSGQHTIGVSFYGGWGDWCGANSFSYSQFGTLYTSGSYTIPACVPIGGFETWFRCTNYPASVSLSLTHSSISAGVSNLGNPGLNVSVSATPTFSYNNQDGCPSYGDFTDGGHCTLDRAVAFACTTVSGTVTLTRPGS